MSSSGSFDVMETALGIMGPLPPIPGCAAPPEKAPRGADPAESSICCWRC